MLLPQIQPGILGRRALPAGRLAALGATRYFRIGPLACHGIAMVTKRDPLSLLPLRQSMFYVLVALADGQTHGYAIIKDVEQLTNGSV